MITYLFSENEIRLITDKLAINGHILKEYNEERTCINVYPHFMCYLTYDGLLFLEKGGFKYENKIERRRQSWIVAKIIAATLNAVIIISIGFWSIKVQSDSKEKDETIKKIEKKIEILSVKVDSLTTKQKTIKHD